MGKYIGSLEDFIRLFSSSLGTNAVQTISKKFKTECKFKELELQGECSSYTEFEAAHRRGYERKDIMKYVLYRLQTGNKIDYELFQKEIASNWNPSNLNIDFDTFLTEFKQFHKNHLNEIIIPLCRYHHDVYDKRKK